MKHSRLALIALFFTLALLTITGCGGAQTTGAPTDTPPPAGAAVDIREMNFDPPSTEILVGESVTWTNSDTVAHIVKGDGGIASASLNQGDTYSRTFDTAGTFAYSCGIHPVMKGTVIVK